MTTLLLSIIHQCFLTAMLAAEPLPACTPPPSTKDYPQGAKGDRQALVTMQRVLWKRVQDSSVPPHIQAQCARAWRDLQDMKRIMDGKPLPGQLRPDLDQKRNARRKPTLLASLPSDPPPATEPPSQAQS